MEFFTCQWHQEVVFLGIMNIVKCLIRLSVVLCAAATYSQAATIFDSTGDIDPGITTGGGTLDILSMEVSSNGTDIAFALTLNGNVSTTDWGKFMIGISTGSTASTNTGNGWGRSIQLNSPVGGMDYWIGGWADGTSTHAGAGGGGAGGSEVYHYVSGAWVLAGGTYDVAAPSFSYAVTPGAQSSINWTVPLTFLGLAEGDTFYFDAYSSGGGSSDSAVDALSNPNVSITTWEQSYTSSTVGSGGVGLSSYTIVPEPSTFALLGLGGIAFATCRSRRRLHS